MRSRAHQGTSVPCPFCRKAFVAASGLSHHLETGSCPSAPQANRNTIYQSIRQRDTAGVITKRQLEWYPSHVEVTESAWNGRGYECYLCHRVFGSAGALERHVNDGPHRDRLYHCPKAGCGREFRALAGLFNHLESEACGFTRFQVVNQQVNRFFDPSRAIAF